MRLTFDEIKSVTDGALRVTEEADGIHFYRCTEKQTETWRQMNGAIADRSLFTTGVRLDFYTNARTLSFLASSGNKFEVWVNDLLRARFEADKYREAGEIPTVSLCDSLGHDVGEVRVTLWLPYHSVGVLEYVELDDGATLRPYTDYQMKILFIGDSITQGWEARHDSLAYTSCVASHYNASFLNQGLGSAYYHEDCFDSLDFDPDIVSVAYGTNDFGVYPTYDEFRSHVRAHLSLIVNEYKGKQIFVLTPIWRGKHLVKKMGTFEGAREIVKAEAEALGCTVIDGLTLVPPIPEFFADAWLHPNDLGFCIYAQNLIKALDKHRRS